jgi:hypothetical protein
VLEIAGEAKSDCLGMTIANVKLVESADLKAEVKTQGRFNFLRNGDFAKNHLGSEKVVITKSLPGWEIPHEVEQGYGSIYNANWGHTIVVELDGYVNDVLKQRIDLECG